jgi:SAM-dependent methyltransferase
MGEVQGEVLTVSKESRKKLASLSFSEKIKLLEKLRERSLALAEARKKLKAKMPERSGNRADGPLRGRELTSHERMAGQPWDASYQGESPAPWDIGRPQPAVVRLASEGGFIFSSRTPKAGVHEAPGAVLDAGCGTGENALHIAALGLPVLGVDVAETALTMAREKAAERKIEIEFAAVDAFYLERLGRSFKTVLDCGLFHAFNGDERRRYVASLARVTERDAILYVLCFSDKGPETGPHPVSKAELRAAFNRGSGWEIMTIERERIQTRFHGDKGAPAWLARIKRI